ncbi:MAG: hypothetical protein GY719_13495 [bacterium]|nr:hypothetical protein [bacterium]
MAEYSTVRNALEMFSVQLGLDDNAACNMVRRSLKNPAWRLSLETELRRLVADAAAPWADLVANDVYEIDEPETDDEARQVVIDALWQVVFPDERPP